MLRAFLALSLIANLNAAPDAKQEFIDSSQWQAASLLSVPPVPVKDPSFVSPVIESEGAIAVDIGTGEVLFAKNEHKSRAIASLTKIMTAVVILEENDLDEVVTISKSASEEIGSQIYLKEGEQMTVRNLLTALLVASANDAAYSLAEYNAGSVDNFVAKMNKKAKMLGLYNTSFANPVGLDDENNYSSPYDLAILGRYAYRKPFVSETVSIKETQVSSVNGVKHNLVSTNKILGGFLNIEGIKTGRTEDAGLCLMSVGNNSKGKKVLSIVLDSPDRFRETKILLDWVFRAYKW